MSINLLCAGYKVLGFDTNAKAMVKFTAEGGIALETSQAVVEQIEVIMISLPTSQIVERIYKLENRVSQYAKKGSLLIDFSTVNPGLNDSFHKEAKELGYRYLGATVSGGAINVTLTIMVGGEQEDYQSGTLIF